LIAAGDAESGIAEGRAALELNPNSAFVGGILSRILGAGEFHEKAIDHGQRALRASPHDPLTGA
jgi:hypothetical protein